MLRSNPQQEVTGMIDASWEGGSIMVWQKVFNVFSVVSVRDAQDEKGCNINLIWIYPLLQNIMREVRIEVKAVVFSLQSQNVVKLSVNNIKNWQAVVITSKVAMREPKRKSIFIYHLPVPVEGGKNKIPFPQYSQYTSLLDRRLYRVYRRQLTQI